MIFNFLQRFSLFGINMFEVEAKCKWLPVPVRVYFRLNPYTITITFSFLRVRSLEDITSLNYPADAFGATLFSLAAQMCQRGADLWVVRAGPSATQHLKQAYFSFPASLMDHRWADVVSLIFNSVYFTSVLTIFRSTLVLSGGLPLPFCVSAYLLVVRWNWCLNARGAKKLST